MSNAPADVDLNVPASSTPETAASSAAFQSVPHVPANGRDARTLRELTPEQVKSGIAAWLGWFFDGLDMHLYLLVAAPFVASLLAASQNEPAVKQKSAFIQAAFLFGWAIGGGFFGRVGDRVGRSRALSLTILTYALFTGFSFFVTSWWQLMICRFLAALGIGGEWAVGSSLLAETWPSRWRAWIAAVLQTGVNIGVLIACAAYYILASDDAHRLLQHFLPALPREFYLRGVFLLGILPALIVFWIRRHVPEPVEWVTAAASAETKPTLADLFRGPVRSITLRTIGVCAFSLTGWWAFMFWHVQHLRTLDSLAGFSASEKERLISTAFFSEIGVSVAGNFFCAWVARLLGYRRSIALMCVLFFLAMAGAYYRPRTYTELLPWLMAIGFCSGVFGLFTMYLPPLFPTLLRTTGAGFSFNVGRIAAAVGTIVFAVGLQVGNFQAVLLFVSLLFLPAALIALTMPDLRDPAAA